MCVVGVLTPSPHVTDSQTRNPFRKLVLSCFWFSIVFPNKLWWRLLCFKRNNFIFVRRPRCDLGCDKTDEEALETSFQALEIVGAAYVEPFKLSPYLSSTSLMIAKTMLKKEYKYGMGLGKDGKGVILPLELVENKGRYGLGYKPIKADKRRTMEERKEISLTKLEGREPKAKGITLCDIKQSFRSTRWINVDQVVAIEKEHGDEDSNFVCPCPPDVQLGNWESVNLSMVFTCDEM